jgi:hypothetical protein
MIAVFLPYIIFSDILYANTVFINKIFFFIWQQYFNGVIHFTLKPWDI